MSTTVLQELADSKAALTAALQDATVLACLTSYGYHEEKLQAGLQLYEEARTCYRAQQQANQDQVAATAAFQLLWGEANKLYTLHLTTARSALAEDREAWRALQLGGTRPVAFMAWYAQAHHFYQVLLDRADYQQKLVEAGLASEKFADAAQKVEQLYQARLVQDASVARNQSATRNRQSAHQALTAWMSDFRKVARVAVAGLPEVVKVKLRLVKAAKNKTVATGVAEAVVGAESS